MANVKNFVQYRIKEVTRYIVTRFESKADGAPGESRQIGNEFASADTAYEVGYALARQEAELKGLPPHSPSMRYPMHPRDADVEAVDPDPLNNSRPIGSGGFLSVGSDGRVTEY